MPGIFLTIKSSAGHDFRINDTAASVDAILKRLDRLHCNNCGDVDFKGRVVEVCSHVICKQCSKNPMHLTEALKDRCTECVDAITGNMLKSFDSGTQLFLEELIVCCIQPKCTQQDILKQMDHHMELAHTEHQLLSEEVMSPWSPDESNANQLSIVTIDLGYF